MSEAPVKRVYILHDESRKVVRKSRELYPTSEEFLDVPVPEVIFQGRSFCFTGFFISTDGNRRKCEQLVHTRGGICEKTVVQSLDYLVIGSYAEPRWANEKYGRKIEKALDNREFGKGPAIISEAHWMRCIQKTPELPVDMQTSEEAILIPRRVNPRKTHEPQEVKPGPLNGSTFVITGTLSEPREFFVELIKDLGGIVSGSVTSKTTYLLSGEEAGSKLARAGKLGVQVLSEDEFRNLLEDTFTD